MLYYEMSGFTLFQGDCRSVMHKMDSQRFDLIFADPPYFLSNGGVTCQSGRMVSVDKGHWDRPANAKEMHRFNSEWLRECQRLLRPNGSIFVSGTHHSIFSVGFAMQELGFKILNQITWVKKAPPPNLCCRYFTHATETIIWAARDGKSRHKFNYQDMKAENGGKQMLSAWRMGAPRKAEKACGKHPTQKPLELLERIVRAASDPGDCVLDPFTGGGTTGIACSGLGRMFVGIEREPEYLDLAIRRFEFGEGEAR